MASPIARCGNPLMDCPELNNFDASLRVKKAKKGKKSLLIISTLTLEALFYR